MTLIEIAGRRIGPGQPCFVIAEAGVNHNGSTALALRLVDAAAAAGADAVKFQAFKAERLVSPTAPKAEYQLAATGGAESHFEMIRRLELTADALRQIQAHCMQRGILFLATPFDEESSTQLDAMNVPLFKISSGEVINLPFLTHVAQTGRPIVLSTGMCDLREVGEAVRTIRAAGHESIVLLQCVSNYPAAPADTNLRAMQTMAEAFRVAVGYSDHTLGHEVALAAVALGACVVEKHLTLDRAMPGPDHHASSEPAEFAALVRGIRVVESALGDGSKSPAASERNTAEVARKSLVAARDLPAGTVLTADTLTAIRPGTGLSPALQTQLLGRRLRHAIPAHTPLTFEMLD
jgi:N,N'-diacetyllegionaminate synthase